MVTYLSIISSFLFGMLLTYVCVCVCVCVCLYTLAGEDSTAS